MHLILWENCVNLFMCFYATIVMLRCMSEVMFLFGPSKKFMPQKNCAICVRSWSVLADRDWEVFLRSIALLPLPMQWHINRPVLNFSVFSDRGTTYARLNPDSSKECNLFINRLHSSISVRHFHVKQWTFLKQNALKNQSSNVEVKSILTLNNFKCLAFMCDWNWN